MNIPVSDVALLCTLSDIVGPPGHETEVSEAIAAMLEPLGVRLETDPLGNLLVRLPSSGGKPVVMLDCHTDEIGFLVSAIDDRGFCSIVPLGGWDERIVPAQIVTIATRDGARVRGAIGTPPPHIQSGERKVIKLHALRCDIGARSAEEAAEMGVRVGDPAVLHYPAGPLGRQGGEGEPEALIGKAFDNRAGCAAVVRLIERFVADPPADVDVVASFSVAEEVGLRGARTAAYTLDPAFALAIEGTVAADVPGVPESLCPSRQTQGAAISVADRTLVVKRELVILAEELAAKHEIPAQLKTPGSGGTDAGAIHVSRGGVPSMVISAPCRYIHSPVTTLRLSDWRAVVDLAEAVVRNIGPHL